MADETAKSWTFSSASLFDTACAGLLEEPPMVARRRVDIARVESVVDLGVVQEVVSKQVARLLFVVREGADALA